MRKRKTEKTKEECMDEITGKSQIQRTKALLAEIKSRKTDKIFISSKKLFPHRKELLIEVKKSTTQEQRDEIIKRKMEPKNDE